MATKSKRIMRLLRARPQNFAAAVDMLMAGLTGQADRTAVEERLIESLGWIPPHQAPAPPRTSAVQRSIREVARLSKELRAGIRTLGVSIEDHRHLLLPSPLLAPDLRRQLGEAGLWCADTDQEGGAPLLAQLITLEATCRNLRSLLPRDRGGRGTIVSGRIGNWKAQLVEVAAYLFSDLCPGKISSTVGGPFYSLCCELYEVLTGEGSEEKGAGLKRYVEYVAPRMRELEELTGARPRRFGSSGMKLTINPFAPRDPHTKRRILVLQRELQAGPSGRSRV